MRRVSALAMLVALTSTLIPVSNSAAGPGLGFDKPRGAFGSLRSAVEAARRASGDRDGSNPVVPFRASAWTGCGVTLTPAVTNEVGFQNVIPDGSGGVIVAWSDGRNADLDAFASRLDANGDFVAGWGAGGNALTLSDSSQLVIGTGTDNAGGLFAVYVNVDPQMDNAHDIYLQRLLANGTVAGGYPANGILMATGPLETGGMISDGAGGLFFGWAAVGGTLRAKRLDAAGNATAGWPAGGIDTGIPGDNVGFPAIDGVGGFYIAWPTATTLNVQRFTSTGVAAGWPGGGLVISNDPASGDVNPWAVRLSSGDVLIVWSDPTSGHVFAQRVTSAGAVHASWPAGGLEVGTSTDPQGVRDVIADGAGGALIMWEESSFIPVFSFKVFVQRVTATAGISAGWPAAGVSLSDGTTAFGGSNLVSDGADGAVAAWTEIGGGDGDIYLQRVLANGTTHAGFTASGVSVCSAAGDQFFPMIASDGANGAIVTWQDLADIDHPQLRVGRVSSGGTVAALASLVDAAAEPGRVRLHWFTPDASVQIATVERASGGEFAAIGVVEADGDGHLRFEDRDVTPGATYQYRLVVLEGAEKFYLGAVTVRVPVGVSFRIAGFRPNPAQGEVNVAFALESDAPALLEVVDVAGRRVLEREVGSMGPGEHLLRLDGELPAGVYLVRLTQAGRSVVARAAIVR